LTTGQPVRSSFALALLGTLVACRQTLPTVGLPDTLAAVLTTSDGHLVSVLVELPRPGVEPVVRLAPGGIAVDQGWTLAVLATPNRAGDTETVVMDLGDGRQNDLLLSGPTRFESIDRGGVIVRDDAAVWRIGPAPGDGAVPYPMVPRPGGSATHIGPAGGFGVRVEDGRLELLLPREDGDWTPVIHDVKTLIGSWWFVADRLPPWQRRVVDDRFKQVGLVRPVQGEVTIDGRLDEWRGQKSLAVDKPSQILVGQAGWRGVRDGGMGVAARRRSDGVLVLGVRVRDDAWMPGCDTLTVRLPDREINIDLAGDTIQLGSDWRAVIGRDGASERTVEVGLDGVSQSHGVVAGLMIELLDSDPGEPVTLLATAPWPAAVALGAIALTPAGPERHAPQ